MSEKPSWMKCAPQATARTARARRVIARDCFISVTARANAGERAGQRGWRRSIRKIMRCVITSAGTMNVGMK
jgi:hypothetical protein